VLDLLLAFSSFCLPLRFAFCMPLATLALFRFNLLGVYPFSLLWTAGSASFAG
jgi:hypothetical protein